ncbi:hypothetical protein JYG23_08795 [Sedimentibacter sp. zth1]|uniref:hypothetical protein n=1 Tax=Sedimentibacter sp. zth1 TaxID=2816908 RepID=UPI001A91BD36|nr:hypothetical protein [Sedimentibacter sp. zth1]QSX04803.1 hypothetical protein JYG23_08795 [Sedimentibacter sp. zth1]
MNRNTNNDSKLSIRLNDEETRKFIYALEASNLSKSNYVKSKLFSDSPTNSLSSQLILAINNFISEYNTFKKKDKSNNNFTNTDIALKEVIHILAQK